MPEESKEPSYEPLPQEQKPEAPAQDFMKRVEERRGADVQFNAKASEKNLQIQAQEVPKILAAAGIHPPEFQEGMDIAQFAKAHEQYTRLLGQLPRAVKENYALSGGGDMITPETFAAMEAEIETLAPGKKDQLLQAMQVTLVKAMEDLLRE